MSILIRQATQEDASDLQAIFSDVDVLEKTSLAPTAINDFVTDWLAREHCHRLVAEVDNNVVGQLSINTSDKPRIKHVASLAIAVNKHYQCKGIGRALMTSALDLADNWLNIVRLELNVYTDNEHAIELYKHYGFEIEGEKRCSGFKNGQYIDSFIMARIRST